MNRQFILRLFSIMMLTFGFNNCANETDPVTKPSLSLTEKQELQVLSRKLWQSLDETGAFRKPPILPDDVFLHEAMLDFIHRIRVPGNTEKIDRIISHPLFNINRQASVVRSNEDEIQLSALAQDKFNDLAANISGHLDEFFNSPDTINFNPELLSGQLLAIVTAAETDIQTSINLGEAEILALLSSCEIQRNLIPELVENANDLFQTTPTGGRTKGFFKKLGRFVGSIVVSMAAGAVIGGVIGGIIGAGMEDGDAGQSALAGAGIGAAVGGIIGIYQATQGRCATTWDFKKTFPLIDYVQC